MDYEDSTIKVFSQNAVDYLGRQPTKFQEEEKEMFMKSITAGGKILDLGCGPGNDALFFQQHGFDVLAVDGAPGMIKLAKQKGLKAMILKYSELDQLKEKFNGIWASYSLLHLAKKDLATILQKIKGLLTNNGVFYASFREGDGQELRADDRYGGGRFFAYYHDEELKDIFGQIFSDVVIGHVIGAGPKGGIYALVK